MPPLNEFIWDAAHPIEVTKEANMAKKPAPKPKKTDDKKQGGKKGKKYRHGS